MRGKGWHAMTDEEIRAEIAKQIGERLGQLSSRLRETATEHGPVIRKALSLAADDIDRVT